MSDETKDANKVGLSRRNLLKVTAAGLLAGAAIPLLPYLGSTHSNASGTGRTKMLIIYYSLTGNTKYIAEQVRKKTGGDVFEIETVKTYPAEYSALTEEAKRELQTGDLPALKKNPPDMSSYDLILVGSPVWWYTVSTPVMSFLRQADFAGKKVSAFCTHEGGIGKFFPDFKEQAKNAVVLEGLDLYNVRQARRGEFDKALDSWLSKLQGK
ncbi:MAG: flavodoxin [Syntrophales bacterium]|jgi:flavodoxin